MEKLPQRTVPTQDLTPTMPPAARKVALRLLGAPVVYSVYFVIAYFLVEIGCTLGFLQGRVAGMSALTLVVLLLTLVTIAIILVLGLPAVSAWRQARATLDDSGADPQRFANLAGAWLMLLFLLVTALTGIAEVTLSRCRWT